MILMKTLPVEEHRQIWDQARAYANKIRQTNATHLVGAEVVPN